MRAFSELAPGEPFFWQGKQWQKIEPKPNTDKPHKPPYNACQVVSQWITESDIALVCIYATFEGWLVMVEPADVAELTPVQAEAVTP